MIEDRPGCVMVMSEKEMIAQLDEIAGSRNVEEAIANERARLESEELEEDIQWTDMAVKDYEMILNAIATGQPLTGWQRKKYESCKSQLEHFKRKLITLRRKKQQLRASSGRQA